MMPTSFTLGSSQAVCVNNAFACSLRSNPSLAMAELRKISDAELRAHSTPSDAWVAIAGDVYDVTRFLALHPGGETVLLPVLELAVVTGGLLVVGVVLVAVVFAGI